MYSKDLLTICHFDLSFKLIMYSKHFKFETNFTLELLNKKN